MIASQPLDHLLVSTTLALISLAAFMQAVSIALHSMLVYQYRGARNATAGNLSLAVGISLIALRGTADAWLTIVGANLLLVLGLALFYLALRRFTGLPVHWLFLTTVFTILVSGLIYFTYSTDNLQIRALFVSLSSVAILIANIRTLYQADNHRYRRAALFISVPFAVYAILLLFHALYTLLAPPVEFFTMTYPRVLIWMALLVVSFFWSSGYINLVSQRLQHDLTALAATDSLTNIANRRAAVGFLEKQFARRALDPEFVFSVLIIDFDKFKAINDGYGHDAGDYTLRAVAETLRRAIRATDLLARWGGDEFIIVLAGASLHDAYHLAERLRVQVQDACCHFNQIHYQLTISVGVSCSDTCQTIDDLFKKADLALYEAKKERNTVFSY